MHTLRVFSLFLFTSFLSIQVSAQSSNHRTEAWMVQSVPQRVLYSNGYTMVTGGPLHQTSRYSGSGIPVDLTTAQPDFAWPKISGTVTNVISDGQGGWYVGGDFDYVDTVKIMNLVHLKADKTVDRTWKPNPDNSITSMQINGNTLYISGYFTTIATQTRNFLAAFDTSSGSLKNWNPNANGNVRTLEFSNNTVYVGGYFSSIGGQPRSYLAALDPDNGTATSWNPSVNNGVFSLTVDAPTNTIFIGGYFTSAGGATRSRLARLVTNTSAGLATAWVADLNSGGYVYDLVLKNNVLYVGGSFNSVNGSTRYGIAAVDVTKNTGNVLSWDAKLNSGSWIEDMDVTENTLYITGYFNSVNGASQTSIAALNLEDAALVNGWNPKLSESALAVAISANTIFIGGYFNGVSSKDVNGTVVFENATDTPWPYDLDLKGGTIKTMVVNGSTLYIGGAFTSANGQNRKNLAAINLTNGEVLPWAPSAHGTTSTFDNTVVNTMEIRDNLLYVGGIFLNISVGASPTPRANLAALDLATGEPSSWNPVVGDGNNTSQYVFSLDILDNVVYVGGSFSLIGGEARTNLAAVNATTGQILPWKPNVSDGTITKIQVSGNTAYVLGTFTKTIGGAERTQGIAGLDITTGLATSWNPTFFAGSVSDFTLSSSQIFVGGDFQVVRPIKDEFTKDEERSRIAAFNLSNGELTSFDSDIRQPGEAYPSVNSLVASPSRLHVVGYFEYLGLENRTNYAEYDICTPFKPMINITGGSALCPGQNTTLQGPAGFASYQWSTGSGSQSIVVSGEGTYTLSVTDAAGCTGESNPVTISVKVLPQISISQNGSTLTVTSADSYQWYQSNQPVQGATSQTFDISLWEYGVYAVEASINGCSVRSNDFTYLVTDKEKEISSSVNVYPNPFNDVLNIRASAESTITILDVLGQPVKSARLNFNSGENSLNTINTYDLKSGTYILIIHSGNNTNTLKIIKTY